MPVFIIGTQRSGSNLLRLMLNQLPNFAAPHPPHILERLMPLVHNYGDLAKDTNFNQLVDDVCALVETNPVKWDEVELDRQEVRRRCSERSLLSVYASVHDIMAETWGAEDWLCKSMANVYYLPEIEAYFGDKARYIYLYRDGRDVALSFQKALIGDKTPYHLAKVWHQEQQLSLACQQRVDAKHFVSVSYEELTNHPESALKRVCDCLDVDYKPEMMDYHESKEANLTAVTKLWSNVTRPVDNKNSNKFLKESSQEDIEIYESVAGASLDALGYQRYFIDQGKELHFSAETLDRFQTENERLKQQALQNSDPQDLVLRQPQSQLLNTIKSRTLE